MIAAVGDALVHGERLEADADKALVSLRPDKCLTQGSANAARLSVTPSSMMRRLKRTPMMPLSSGTSSNSASGDLHSGCRSRFFGVITISGFRNCRWICMQEPARRLSKTGWQWQVKRSDIIFFRRHHAKRLPELPVDLQAQAAAINIIPGHSGSLDCRTWYSAASS